MKAITRTLTGLDNSNPGSLDGIGISHLMTQSLSVGRNGCMWLIYLGTGATEG